MKCNYTRRCWWNIATGEREVDYWIIGFVTRLTRPVPLVEQELPTLQEHQSSTPVFSGVCVSRSLVLCVCFVDRCLSFCTFSFGHCIICTSSIYGFWLPLGYLRFTDSNCPLGIFNLLWLLEKWNRNVLFLIYFNVKDNVRCRIPVVCFSLSFYIVKHAP